MMHLRRLVLICLYLSVSLTSNAYRFLKSEDGLVEHLQALDSAGQAVHAARGQSTSEMSEESDAISHTQYHDFGMDQKLGRSLFGADSSMQGGGSLPPVPNVPGGSTRNLEEPLLLYREIPIHQNGTAALTSANQSLNPNLPLGATSFSFKSDLLCGTSNNPSPSVGFCLATGRITKQLPNDKTAAQAMIDGQCDLNSNAGIYCDYKLKGGATVLFRGLGAVKVYSREQYPNQTYNQLTAIEAIYADRLFVRDIQYNEGPDTVMGALTSLTNTAIGFKRGVVKLNAMRTVPSDSTLVGSVLLTLSL